MHNLHYLIVSADTGKEACDDALRETWEWGDSNNWRCAGGAVCEDGEVYLTGDARWEPNSDDTVESIEQEIIKEAEDNSVISDEAKEIARKIVDDELADTTDIYILRKSLEELSASAWFGKARTFKEGMEYRSWELDEFGATNMYEGDGKLWVVYLDMHS